MSTVATAFTHNSEQKQIITQPNSIPSRIAHRAVKQGARPTIPYQVVVEKITTEKKDYPKLLNPKKNLIVGSLNTQILQKLWKIPELITSAEVTKQDIIFIQEDMFIHDDILIK